KPTLKFVTSVNSASGVLDDIMPVIFLKVQKVRLLIAFLKGLQGLDTTTCTWSISSELLSTAQALENNSFLILLERTWKQLFINIVGAIKKGQDKSGTAVRFTKTKL
ncbi:hypothetical protein ACJX0J_009317, partial [Zea mays]